MRHQKSISISATVYLLYRKTTVCSLSNVYKSKF